MLGLLTPSSAFARHPSATDMNGIYCSFVCSGAQSPHGNLVERHAQQISGSAGGSDALNLAAGVLCFLSITPETVIIT